MTTSRFPACCYRDRGQRLEKSATHGPTQILRLSGYRLLTKEKEIMRKATYYLRFHKVQRTH